MRSIADIVLRANHLFSELHRSFIKTHIGNHNTSDMREYGAVSGFRHLPLVPYNDPIHTRCTRLLSRALSTWNMNVVCIYRASVFHKCWCIRWVLVVCGNVITGASPRCILSVPSVRRLSPVFTTFHDLCKNFLSLSLSLTSITWLLTLHSIPQSDGWWKLVD